MPDSEQDAGDVTVCIGCIELRTGCIDLYGYAGHVDLTAASGSTGGGWDRRVDLCNGAGSTARDQCEKHHGY